MLFPLYVNYSGINAHGTNSLSYCDEVSDGYRCPLSDAFRNICVSFSLYAKNEARASMFLA